MLYRRQPETPLPHDRTFIVNLADGTSLRIWASSQMVTIYKHRKLHEEPLWRASFMIADNPQLATLYTPRLGWDIVGLISLMRSEIEKMTTFDFSAPEVRQLLDSISTVTQPSQKPQRQAKRPVGEGVKLILQYVDEHPHCTRLQIARGIDRAKSPHLIVQIEWLVRQGHLARSHATSASGTLEYRYVFLSPIPDNGD